MEGEEKEIEVTGNSRQTSTMVIPRLSALGACAGFICGCHLAPARCSKVYRDECFVAIVTGIFSTELDESKCTSEYKKCKLRLTNTPLSIKLSRLFSFQRLEKKRQKRIIFVV